MKLLRTPCFIKHLLWLLLKVSDFQPATLLRKRLRKSCFAVNFAEILRTSFLLTEHLRITAFCVYLWILRRFSENFFIEHSGRMLFYVQVAEFQPPDTVKIYFTGAFQAFYARSRSSHSKEFIYLESQQTVCEGVNLSWSCEMPTCKLTKKNSFTHPLSYNLLSFSQNTLQ